ncbi:MAG: HlyD family secretion protein [Verrucomicrobiota bacterium]
MVAVVVCCGGTHAVQAQKSTSAMAGEMVMVESAAATQVVESVRAAMPGVMVEMFVKVGDLVQKDQILGHTELEATKLQLDLAKQAMDAKANVKAAGCQAAAWTITREETQLAVRRRKADGSRLDWALAMEKMYQGTYEAQLEAEHIQEIQYTYWKSQYERRFLRAPVDGVVTEVLVEVGKPVNYATHVLTVSNDHAFAVPVSVPAPMAAGAQPNQTVAVRAADGKSVTHAKVNSIMDDPRAAGRKIIQLLVQAADFPLATRLQLKGMKFDVMLSQAGLAAAR